MEFIVLVIVLILLFGGRFHTGAYYGNNTMNFVYVAIVILILVAVLHSLGYLRL